MSSGMPPIFFLSAAVGIPVTTRKVPKLSWLCGSPTTTAHVQARLVEQRVESTLGRPAITNFCVSPNRSGRLGDGDACCPVLDSLAVRATEAAARKGAFETRECFERCVEG